MLTPFLPIIKFVQRRYKHVFFPIVNPTFYLWIINGVRFCLCAEGFCCFTPLDSLRVQCTTCERFSPLLELNFLTRLWRRAIKKKTSTFLKVKLSTRFFFFCTTAVTSLSNRSRHSEQTDKYAITPRPNHLPLIRKNTTIEKLFLCA